MPGNELQENVLCGFSKDGGEAAWLTGPGIVPLYYLRIGESSIILFLVT